ncbi:Transmembrane protein [Orchesella cincta]|uniref:Transmembrane protein n=1 Tax=Orchesella cincta TaxID=48709 RepID=A0A1D2MDU4_ORCCI|nr:Transmembrane protein [Orchesella cincta]
MHVTLDEVLLFLPVLVKKMSDSTDSEDDTISLRRENGKDKERRSKAVSARKGMSLALTSGVFAALGGTEHLNYTRQQSYVMCDKAAIYIRGLAFVAMILVNAVMWRTFVQALRYCKTSLEATVTNTAANFFASAVVGQLLFDESVSLMWWLGTLLIVFVCFL